MRPVPILAVALLLSLAACDSDGPEQTIATADSRVVVAYEGRLENGAVFDSSPSAEFNLAGTIPGFRSNVAGMEVGETKTFDVPPEEGYGSTPVRDRITGEVIIPANSTLTFEVTLLDIVE